ncbi:hypothetical protein [Caenimonas aquaedulcis]|uniref:Uncharacterized protein n=1 Tax=Caenimonas aquaedulcis TaxID=2793270 RepID=A0A931MFB3_9BURK|nr:hypothetical protein [Caenimonas aquaedulcis]MBG9386929.1 hypothetical protein [Caenimonas aquaedulcis]
MPASALVSRARISAAVAALALAGAAGSAPATFPGTCYLGSSAGHDVPLPAGGGGGEFLVSRCAVTYMPDAGKAGGVRMQAIAIGSDGRVYHSAQADSSARWSAWKIVPGRDGAGAGLFARKIAIAGSKDGSSEIVVVAQDGGVYHTVRDAHGAWSGFQPLEGPDGPAFAARDVAIAIGGSSAVMPGTAQVVASGLAGGVFHLAGTRTGARFQPVPGAAEMDADQLAIAAAEDGTAHLLATVNTGSGSSVQRQFRDASGRWDPSFVKVSLPLSSVPYNIALTLSRAGHAQLLYTDQSGAWLQERSDPSSASSWRTAFASSFVAPAAVTASISAPPGGSGGSAVLYVRRPAP